MSLLLGTGATLFLRVQPFLAITHRVPTDVLVVEGWIPRYAIDAAVSEFNSGSYLRAYTTGGPVNDSALYEHETAAQLGAARLIAAGLSKDLIQEVSSHTKDRDRTYSSAIALRDWLQDHKVPLRSLNVLTVGVHARRTQLLYQIAFGQGVKVGIISVPDDDYPAARWWRYSDGVRNVIGETIAYLYARLLFSPTRDRPSSDLAQQVSPCRYPVAAAPNRLCAETTLLQVHHALAYQL